MNIALYAVAGFLALGALLSVGTVGKPRKPLEPGAAALVVLFTAAMIVVLIFAAGRLG